MLSFDRGLQERKCDSEPSLLAKEVTVRMYIQQQTNVVDFKQASQRKMFGSR